MFVLPALCRSAASGADGTPAAPADDAAGYESLVREQLLALYHDTDGPQWRLETLWNTAVTVCSWYGVSCTAVNPVTQAVTRTDARAANTTPPTHATVGSTVIPTNVTAPRADATVVSIVTGLSLAENRLSGSLPAGWWVGGPLFRTLRFLNLSHNELQGVLFPTIHDTIHFFSPSKGPHGTTSDEALPETLNEELSLGQTFPLLEVDVSGNQLTFGGDGSFAALSPWQTIGRMMPKLTYLNLSMNRFAADISPPTTTSPRGGGPPANGQGPTLPLFSSLQSFDMSHNRITGTLHAFRRDQCCPNLTVLNAAGNFLVGDPCDISSPSAVTASPPSPPRPLRQLDLRYNYFTGQPFSTIAADRCRSLLGAPNLTHLRLGSNRCGGVISAAAVGLLSRELLELDLSDNAFEGSLDWMAALAPAHRTAPNSTARPVSQQRKLSLLLLQRNRLGAWPFAIDVVSMLRNVSAHLPVLKELRIDSNAVVRQHFPAALNLSVFNVPNLTVLSLGGSNLWLCPLPRPADIVGREWVDPPPATACVPPLELPQSRQSARPLAGASLGAVSVGVILLTASPLLTAALTVLEVATGRRVSMKTTLLALPGGASLLRVLQERRVRISLTRRRVTEQASSLLGRVWPFSVWCGKVLSSGRSPTESEQPEPNAPDVEADSTLSGPDGTDSSSSDESVLTDGVGEGEELNPTMIASTGAHLSAAR